MFLPSPLSSIFLPLSFCSSNMPSLFPHLGLHTCCSLGFNAFLPDIHGSLGQKLVIQQPALMVTIITTCFIFFIISITIWNYLVIYLLTCLFSIFQRICKLFDSRDLDHFIHCRLYILTQYRNRIFAEKMHES